LFLMEDDARLGELTLQTFLQVEFFLSLSAEDDGVLERETALEGEPLVVTSLALTLGEGSPDFGSRLLRVVQQHFIPRPGLVGLFFLENSSHLDLP